jgi:hypothetical protein
MLAEDSLLQRNLKFKQVAEFVAEQFLTTGIKQQVSQYFKENFNFGKGLSVESYIHDEPVIISNFPQKNSVSDNIIKHEREVYAQYDKIVGNPKESKILKQLNENISKKYQ